MAGAALRQGQDRRPLTVDHPYRHLGFRFPSLRTAKTAPASADMATAAATATRAHVFAGLRVLTGFVFLWAFLDKTFGFGYATGSGKGWTDGGSPTKGFLSGVAAGPMESTFHDWAGAAWADWLFMLGLLGIGLALISGIALRLAAVAGTAMMAFMWIAEWPPAKHLSDGSLSMSMNPFVDYHLIYAIVLIALAAAGAGATWDWARPGRGCRSSAVTVGCSDQPVPDRGTAAATRRCSDRMQVFPTAHRRGLSHGRPSRATETPHRHEYRWGVLGDCGPLPSARVRRPFASAD